MDTTLVKAYSSDQGGGDLPYFVGTQYGSGWLRTLGRFAFPLLKKVFGVAGRTAEDVLINEKPVLDSLRDNTVREVASTIANPMSLIPSNGSSSINIDRKRAPNKRKRTQPIPFFSKNVKKRRK